MVKTAIQHKFTQNMKEKNNRILFYLIKRRSSKPECIFYQLQASTSRSKQTKGNTNTPQVLTEA